MSNPLRTPADEQARYDAVSAQLKGLLNDARDCPDIVANLLRAQIYAEVYKRNEDAHERYQARALLLGALEWRIARQSRHNVSEHKLPKEVRAVTMPNFTGEDEIVAFLTELAEGVTCPHCHAPITELYQAGRCVYNRGCRCRQYQGVVPKDKRTPKDQEQIDEASLWSPLEDEE